MVRLFIHLPFIMHPEIGKKQDTPDHRNYNCNKTPCTRIGYLCVPVRKKKVNDKDDQQYRQAEYNCHGQAIHYFSGNRILFFPLSFPVHQEFFLFFRQHSAKLRQKELQASSHKGQTCKIKVTSCSFSPCSFS